MSNAKQSLKLEEVWEKLLNGINHLFQFQTLRYSQWMLLYTYIFDYATNNKCSSGADLYENIRNYLTNYLENLCQSTNNLKDHDILELYINQWKKYRISSKILHGICSYLHRHYVQREHDSGNSDICEIYPMAMQIWQQIVSRRLHNQITEICLNMIKAARNHQKIDTEIIRNIIQTYITVDLNEPAFESDDNSRMLDVYKEYFENQFLEQTKQFYRSESLKYLQQYSVSEYISKISQFYDEDIDRITVFIHPSTVRNLLKIFKDVFISDQLAVLHTEAKLLIRDEKSQELNLLFQTVNQVPNGKTELKTMMENHIHQISIDTIERIDRTPTNDLKIYIQTIFDLHQKYLTFIEKAFDNDQDFVDILDRTCRRFINNNAFIQTIGNTTKMAEYLARHCDKLLQKGKKEESNLEIILNQIKILLYYIQEKDVFEKFYSKLLAKRLVNQLSISNDCEKLMISNIQDACGFGYAFKMKQMCQDIETSKTILDQYHRYCETEQLSNKINFSVMVLSSNAWLFSVPPPIILPNKLEFIVKNFNKFYAGLHNGRKIMWLYQHSKGELQAFFTDKVYTLQVSMYQMVILLLFNNSSEWTIERIHDETQIEVDLLFKILNVLLESKILTITGFSSQADLDINSTIKLSNDFTSDKYRINLNIPMKSVEQKDVQMFHKKIDQDRIMVIQATIVRIMKLHKTMNQNLLIQTVIQQLNAHFTPNISIIKDCINALIDKEYLERQSDNTDVIYYVT